MSEPETEQERLTVVQAAEYLGVHTVTIYKALGRGSLPREYNEAGRTVIPLSALDAYRMQSHAIRTSPLWTQKEDEQEQKTREDNATEEQDQQAGEEEYLTVKEASAYIGRSTDAIYAAMLRKQLPRFDWSTGVMTTKSALDKYNVLVQGRWRPLNTPLPQEERQEAVANQSEEAYFTIKEVATMLDVPTQAIYTAQKKGQLPRYDHPTRGILILKTAVEAYKATLQEDIPVPSSPPAMPAISSTESPMSLPEQREEGEPMPACYRCRRQFASEQDYIVKKFIVENCPHFYPVCADGRCDPAQHNWQARYQEEVAKSASLLMGLKAVYQQIGDIIAHYEKETTSDEPL